MSATRPRALADSSNGCWTAMSKPTEVGSVLFDRCRLHASTSEGEGAPFGDDELPPQAPTTIDRTSSQEFWTCMRSATASDVPIARGA